MPARRSEWLRALPNCLPRNWAVTQRGSPDSLTRSANSREIIRWPRRRRVDRRACLMESSNSQRISGLLSPVVTPFDRRLQPDAARLVRHCRWLIEQDVGLAVFGTNSEANSLSVAEKRAL